MAGMGNPDTWSMGHAGHRNRCARQGGRGPPGTCAARFRRRTDHLRRIRPIDDTPGPLAGRRWACAPATPSSRMLDNNIDAVAGWIAANKLCAVSVPGKHGAAWRIPAPPDRRLEGAHPDLRGRLRRAHRPGGGGTAGCRAARSTGATLESAAALPDPDRPARPAPRRLRRADPSKPAPSDLACIVLYLRHHRPIQGLHAEL